MTRVVRLHMDEPLFRRLRGHLLPRLTRTEQAAFLLCGYDADTATFSCLDVMLIQHAQFTIHSDFHLELDDRVRAQVIKTAHDRQCSLVEIHSHPFSGIAQFSVSDFDGLAEFVPHIWWRLRHRPYGALVITRRSIDGLAWIEGPKITERIHAIDVDGKQLPTTGLSFHALTQAYHEPIRPE